MEQPYPEHSVHNYQLQTNNITTMENITAIVDQAAASAERRRKRKADEISQCGTELARLEEEIRGVRDRQRRLTEENRQYELVASLNQDGAKAWKGLTNENKWKKANVLAVLVCSGSEMERILPRELKEDRWNGDTVPAALREDRDILLARLAHKEFQTHYAPYNNHHRRHGTTPIFRLPQQFHGDKEVAITAVKQYPEILKQDVLPGELLDDEELFLAYLHSERLKSPNRVGAGCNGDTFGTLLSKFSEGIRGNAALMLEAAKHIKMNAVLDHFSKGLAGDCIFAKELVALLDGTPKDEALSRFADPVRANREIVLALVQKNGRCLQDASQELKCDEEILRAACKDNASALLFAVPDSQAWYQLGKDKVFLMDIFSRWPHKLPGEPQLYRMVSAPLKLDQDIVVAAHKKGNLSFTDLPEELTGDHGFWTDVIKRDSSIWRELPDGFEDDPAFARAIDCFCDMALVEDVFTRFPLLLNDRSLWFVVIASFEGKELSSSIEAHAPEQIRSDKELMIRACGKDEQVSRVVSADLQRDRDLIEAAINSSGYALEWIPHSSQCLFPDLVAKAFSRCDYVPDLLDNVAPSLWTNMEVVAAWYKAGGFFHSHFPDSMKDNVECGLLVAKRAKRARRLRGLARRLHGLDDDYESYTSMFQEATSVALRSNKVFMTQAVKINCFVFLEAIGALRRDIDLALVACGGAGGSDLVNDCLLGDHLLEDGEYDAYNDELKFLQTVFANAKSKVEDHDGYTKGFLFGMSDHADCNLSMLANGIETSLALKKKIAKYVGVAKGRQLRRLRKAVTNLANLPAPFEPDDEHFCPYCDWCHY